jgi:DNA-directed RNA polymerase subunit RPC12/RpoP
MLCPNCHKEFNSELNLPRILVSCGHTFCHSCLDQLLQSHQLNSQGSGLKCPECGV